MQFGHFDDEAREYVITTPHTPYPWINYLGSQEFFGLISHTGGGYSFYRDAKMRRLTRYRYNNVPGDGGGRIFTINDGGDVWSPGYFPYKAELDHFETRHGMGYSRITGSRGGLEVSALFFVPVDINAEIQQVTLTNTSDAAKSVSLFSFVEFCLWNAEDDQTNYQRNLSIGEVEVVDGNIYHKTEYRERRDHYAVYGVNAPIAGFDTDRDTFLGHQKGFAEAVVPASGKSANSVASGWYPIGSHSLDVTLAPGEAKTFTFTLGYLENAKDEKWESKGVINKAPAIELLARFDTNEKADAEFAKLNAYWDHLLGSYTVSSTDEKLDRMVNIWNQYQCMVTYNMSRSASYFETGIGRGMGFRDSNQDLLGFVHLVPERARERIIDIASTQFEDGSAYHQYQPLTKRGNNAIGSGFNDDPLWLVLGTAAYIKETGDYSILDVPTPFDNDESKATPLMDHLKRSFDHVINNRGPHGLPLIGRADWNDCLNLNCFSDDAWRVIPDHGEPGWRRRGVGIHRGHVRRHRPGLRRACPTPWRRSGGLPRAGGHRRDEAGSSRSRLGWRVVPPRLRLLRQRGWRRRERRGEDLDRAAGLLHHGRHRRRRRQGHPGARFSPRTTQHAPRHRAAEPRVHGVQDRTRRGLDVPAGVQGKRRNLLPQQPVDHHRGDDRWPQRERLGVLEADHARVPRGDLRGAQARALRVRADDRRQGRVAARRSEELVAHGHRIVELRDGVAVPAGRARGLGRARR